MTQSHVIRRLAILFAVLFLFAQGLAQAHTVEYGADHEHDDVVCSVSILVEDTIDLAAPDGVETPLTDETLVITLKPTKTVAFTSAHPCRAPPPRAPPH